MRNLILALLVSFLVSCATLKDYVNDNPLIASIATRQAVAQYIDAGGTPEERIKRARQVELRIQKVLLFVESHHYTTADELLVFVDSTITWNELTYADRLLIQDVLSLLKIELGKAEGQLSPGTTLVLRALFETAISAARIYLRG